MPMMDLDLPAGTFEPAGERELVAKLTDILLKWEGADPSNERVRSIACASPFRKDSSTTNAARGWSLP
jgi:hypothetical protein